MKFTLKILLFMVLIIISKLTKDEVLPKKEVTLAATKVSKPNQGLERDDPARIKKERITVNLSYFISH